MTVYILNKDNCYGNCKIYDFEAMKVDLSECKIGEQEIPCEKLKRQTEILLEKGERRRIGKGLYIEYFNENRDDYIYLDYEKYVAIYHLSRLLGKITFFGITFSNRGSSVMSEYGQIITPYNIDLFYGEQKLITIDGVKDFYIMRSDVLEKGECKRLGIYRKIFCYGDPE